MPLDVLFTCERYGALTHQACRRRQLELRLVEDEKTRKKKPGLPTYAFCSSGECVKGAEIAAALEAEDVSTGVCPRCGTACVGPEADRPCPECAPLREKERQRPVQMSTRIWTGEAPSPGIASPTRRERLERATWERAG